MNEELDEAAVTAAVAGYPRTGRDLADGYLLAALVIRAAYDGEDPEITRALRLYGGDVKRLTRLSDALTVLGSLVRVEAERRYHLESLADAASTVLLPRVKFCNWCPDPPYPSVEFHPDGGPEHREKPARVPGEVTQEIRRPIDPEPPLEWDHPYAPSTLKWSDTCAFLLPRQPGEPVTVCGLPQDHPVHHFPRAALTPLA